MGPQGNDFEECPLDPNRLPDRVARIRWHDEPCGPRSAALDDRDRDDRPDVADDPERRDLVRGRNADLPTVPRVDALDTDRPPDRPGRLWEISTDLETTVLRQADVRALGSRPVRKDECDLHTRRRGRIERMGPSAHTTSGDAPDPPRGRPDPPVQT